MNNLFLLLEEAEHYDYSDGEILLTVGILCIPWFALILYSILKKFKIVYHYRYEEGENEKVEVKKYKANSPIILPSNPVREGYIFAGWYLDPEFETTFPYQTMPGKNLHLYAKWIEK